MRLIDADELKLKICAECTAKEMCVEMKVKEFDLLELVDNQPTAYDIDKVVEQIGNEAECRTTTLGYCSSECHDCRHSFITEFKAIDIIRNGGKE